MDKDFYLGAPSSFYHVFTHFWVEIKNNIYIVLQIQLECTFWYAFIYFDALYFKHLIASLTMVDFLKPIMCLCLNY
jgi:hypothetical protein